MEKKIIPTANELFEQYHGFEADSSSHDIISLMIEFAKLHVQQALKEASEKASVYADEGGYTEFVDGYSILDSYPLENIK